MTLMCNTNESSVENVYWLTPSGLIFFNLNSLDLNITDITADDGGYYVCGDGEGNTYSTIVVYVTPYFPHHIPHVYTTSGSFESITCIAEGFPLPIVYWMSDVLVSGDGYQSGSGELVPNEVELVFDPVLFGDEGIYKCIARNDYGENITNITVTSELLTITMLGL